MIRRTKAEVLSHLPPKTRERVALKLTPEQQLLVEKGVENLRQVENQTNVDPITRKAAFMTLWREIGKVKLPSVIEYVNDLLSRGEKFVLFAHHQFALDELEAFLTRKTVRFIRIDGKTKSKHRKPMIDDFQTNDEVRVALLSITAAGVGIPLFSAHIVVFAELYWTCGALLQAEDRCHRIGQTQPVTVYYLLAEGTADEKIWFILRRKMEVVGEMLGASGDGATLKSDRSVYDEELTQTIMAEFISALTGTRRQFVVEDITSPTPQEVVTGPMDRHLKRQKVSKTLPSASTFVWPPPNFSPKQIDYGSPRETRVILPNPQEYLKQ